MIPRCTESVQTPIRMTCIYIYIHINGVHILDDTQSPYNTTSFVLDTHAMYLAILLARHEASKVLQSTPRTPPLLLSSHPSHPPSHPSQPITLSDVVSPVSVQSSQSG